MQFSNYSAEKSITTPPRCWCSVEYFSCSSSSACQTSLSLSPAAGSVRTVYYLHLDMFCYTQNSMQYTLPFQFPSISVFKDILTCDASNIPAYPWLSKLIIQELNTGRYSPQILQIKSPKTCWKYRASLQTQQYFHACFFLLFLQNLHGPTTL